MAGLTIKTVFAALDRVSGPVKTMQGQVGKYAAAANRATSSIGAGFGRLKGIIGMALGGLTVGAAIHAIDAFAARGDDISDISKRVGMSAEAWQEYVYAAKLADLTSEDLTGVMQKMNNNLGQLKTGTGTLYTNLTKTNPALARQLRTVKDSDQAFSLLMDSIAKETNVQKRAALAQAAFGKSGQAIIDMAGDLNEKRREAHAAGAVISNEDVQNAQRMHNSILRLKSSGMGLLNNVLGRIAASLAPILEKWSAWVMTNRELIGQRIDKVFDGIRSVMSALKEPVRVVFAAFKWLVDRRILFLAGAGIWYMTVAMGALSAAMSGNPIGATILAFEALVIVILVVIRYWKEITGFLISSWNKVNEVFNMPGIRIALAMIAQPLLIILSIIQTIIDLVQGKGAKSFLNLLGPLKGFTDLFGLTKGGGQVGTPVSPNMAGAGGGNWQGNLQIAGAPPGSKYSGGGTAAPAVTLKTGSAFARGFTQ